MINISGQIYQIFSEYPVHKLISNLDTQFILYQVDNLKILATVNTEIKKNCYIASPYALIIDYGLDEIDKLDFFLERFFTYFAIKCAGVCLRTAQIDKVQTLNNHMLSTNFYSSKWENFDLRKLEKEAVLKFPKHTLLLRSLNKIQNPQLIENLEKNGWLKLVSRQVYLFRDSKKALSKKNFKRDLKLLKSKRFIFRTVSSVLDFEKAEQLYNALYLEKYSRQNIQFTALYMQKMQELDLLHLRLLWDCEKEKYVAMVGLVGDEKQVTIPIVGYDFSYASKYALYRRCIVYGMQYAFKHNLLLNLSSGAPDFKTVRGAEAELEYIYVKIEHLPRYRRLVWRILALISNKYYGPMLKRLQL